MNSIHGAPHVSSHAQKLWAAAVAEASARYSCYPRWISLGIDLSKDENLDAFEELVSVGVVFSGFPSIVVALDALWPLGSGGRPDAAEWRRLRALVFERDDCTCQYCGERGGRLECDHIVPVARGGGSDPANLATACFACNRSKRAKSLAEWRAA